MRSAKRLSARRGGARGGFTLVEMLVVIAIIAILASLLAAGAFQAISVRRSGNTELLIKKIDNVLTRQWQYVVNQAAAQPIDALLNPGNTPSGPYLGLLAMAGGDPKRARVIWIKFRLKQEFPMNFTEALSPTASQYVRFGGVPYLPPDHPLTQPKAVYLRAIQGATAPPVAPAASSENSAMLLLAVSQARGGISLSADDLGSGTTNIASSGLPQIVDAWDRPIVFWRWPTANPEFNNIDNGANGPGLPDPAQYAFTGTTQAKFRDSTDPEGTLLNSTWNNWGNYSNLQGVWAFEVLFHSVHFTSPNPAWKPYYTAQSFPKAYYTVPVVASAGKNGSQLPWPTSLGMLAPMTYRSPPGPPPTMPPTQPGILWTLAPPILPDDLVPNPMASVDPNGNGPDSDNIYSHRLRLGARGD
jgi:prepilin-type N-terminal cleavage/methylation domain-containing protein